MDALHQRVRSFDGVRALAILLVFAAHSIFFVSGWMGVDLFFALSGLLITTILRRDRNQSDFWSRFYIRRSTRILPPLLIAIVLAALLFSVRMRQMLPYIFFAGNIAEALHPGGAHTLGVLWSLAVEEHFYLLWPFAIRFLSRRHLLFAGSLIVIAEPLLRALATPHFKTFWPIYLLTPFRLDGLLLGGLLALALEKESDKERLRRLAGPAFLVTCATWLGLSTLPSFDRSMNSVLFNSVGYSLVAVGATCLVSFLLLHPSSVASQIFSWRPLVYLGVVSYGFYLYHVIVLEFTRSLLSAYHIHHLRLLTPVTFLVSIVVASVSFYMYEIPIVRWGKRVSSRDSREASFVQQAETP